MRVDSTHNGSASGAHIAAGWTLSPHWTIGARTIMDRPGSETHTVLVGPQVAWYPFEEELLAFRGGVSFLDVRRQGTWISPNGTLEPREQRYRGSLGHLALTVERPLDSWVVAQLGIELGYAPFGRWHDTSPQPVRGHPWTAAFSVTFGVD